MSNRQLIIVLVLTIIPLGTVDAQYLKQSNKSGIEVGGGASADGILTYGGYIYYFNGRSRTQSRYNTFVPNSKKEIYPCIKRTRATIPPGWQAKATIFYEQGSGKGIRYRVIGIDGAILYTIFNTSSLFLNLKGGLTISNDGLLTPILEDGQFNYHRRFKYGLLGGVEIEWVPPGTKSVSIAVGWDERFLFNKGESWGEKRWYAYAGMRVKIP
jgi:hypothetical protein